MSEQRSNSSRIIHIVEGVRTPILRAKGEPGPFSAADLAVLAGHQLLCQYNFNPSEIGEVIVGCVMPSADEANIARIVALRLGCGPKIPAWTVQRNCASGMQSIDNGAMDIMNGRHELVLVGGTEAMSHAPLLYNTAMINWLSHFAKARSGMSKLQMIAQFRPYMLKPVIALLRGLRDPLIGLNMGQTTERLAFEWNITREDMDTFAIQSHEKLAKAQKENLIPEIVPIFDQQGQLYDKDDGLREGSTIERLAKLKPVFDGKFGKITAANSSQISDGAAMLLLASEKALTDYSLSSQGCILGVEWAALDPAQMGLGPVHAIAQLLQHHELSVDDIDYWEINEAFAGQVLACLLAMQDATYCREQLGLSQPLGQIDTTKLNVDGGAIAIGHPVGASGARLVLHMLKVLQRNKARYGIASLCIGGGQGGALLIENHIKH